MAQDAHIIRWFLGFQNFVQSHEEFRPLAEVTAIGPAEMRNPEAMRLKHAHACLHTLYAPPFEELAIRAVDAYARTVHQAGLPIPDPPPETEAYLSAIRDRGYTKLAPIDGTRVAEMKRHFETSPVYASSSATAETRIPFAEAEATLNLAHHADPDILNCPHFLDIALDPVHLGPAQRFLASQ